MAGRGEMMDFEIKWSPMHMDFYKYGSVVNFSQEGEVTFKNLFFSSGSIIVKWISNPIYQVNRSLLQLPILGKGNSYRLITNLECIPNNSVLIKIDIYNRSGRNVKSYVIENNGGSFIYPKDSYSYSISIINMGVHDFKFKTIRIVQENIKE
ncbi:accessory Sec system protein Asp3 [Lactococcus lactis]|uniref:accessory Sec system protein Asp3 n=1 Tax=Lactococcus lactis TaxID=1358 RepID=UPI00288ED80D|nr:accessory Sec system protein Asp3 [Lactococcus lactis]MDT2887982.1 accessory Sec system protein Asp3 [Lactococcus lactis]MDT2930762.1 accessory Sec system protein Asp3 [Lactococcus lactis]